MSKIVSDWISFDPNANCILTS